VAPRTNCPFDNSSIVCGYLGSPTGRLEVSLDFDNLTCFENFIKSMPREEEQAWLQRAQVVTTIDS
jgi:hypothetical protein